MKYNYINKATDSGISSVGGGYEFGTLWQEITNGIGHMTSAIVNGLQVTERTKQLKAFFGLKSEELYNEREKERYGYLSDLQKNTKGSNTSFYLMMLVVLGFLAAGLYFAVKVSKK